MAKTSVWFDDEEIVEEVPDPATDSEAAYEERFDTAPTLEEARAFVGGGVVETVSIGADDLLIINEWGKALGLPVNRPATEVLRQARGGEDWIAGNAIRLLGSASKRW